MAIERRQQSIPGTEREEIEPLSEKAIIHRRAVLAHRKTKKEKDDAEAALSAMTMHYIASGDISYDEELGGRQIVYGCEDEDGNYIEVRCNHRMAVSTTGKIADADDEVEQEGDEE